MAVPDFQTLMRPLLRLEDGQEHAVRSLGSDLAQKFGLTGEDLAEVLPSGRAKKFQNRVRWATTYLYRSGLIERPGRGVYRITDRGRQVLEEESERVDLKVLSQFEEFQEFVAGARSAPDKPTATAAPGGDEETPEERLESAYRELRSALAAELLDRVMEHSAEFFEKLVLDVLHAIGYGGRRLDSAEHLGRTGDEGVDGVIREDRLGLDLIYVQAKRWENSVGRPEIQKFFGALHGKRATKGVFITTSTFSKEAIEYAEGVTPRVILVDGKELSQLMIEHDVGVSESRAYRVKRLDLDYFASEDDGAVTAVESEPEPPAAVPAAHERTG